LLTEYEIFELEAFESDLEPEAFELEKSESGVYEEELLELD
jgi:hypothetical protein